MALLKVIWARIWPTDYPPAQGGNKYTAHHAEEQEAQQLYGPLSGLLTERHMSMSELHQALHLKDQGSNFAFNIQMYFLMNYPS